MQLRELAERLGCRLEGDGALEIQRVAGLEHAGDGDLSFFANPRYAPLLKRTRATAVILGEGAPAAPCAMLRAKHPSLAFADAVAIFATQQPPAPGVAALSAIAPDAMLGRDVSIGPFSSVGRGARVGDRTIVHPNVFIGDGAVVGDDCIIHSHVAIRERVTLGHRVIIQNGAVIGADGYGFVKRPDGTHQKIPQTAIVVIEDDVEIGANTTIDRPAVGETRIQAGAKIDNLVQIGHGVSVGRNTLLAAQVGIAGSTTIGDDVTLA
ncbi:MAG TPA: UDP-3-O-(3-hydroxymyristoyl)glucosamine N-acyltransferase, partial [Vicinamibacterales bacterium]|nr:UDP-3-O-(3-hydroxymyristoyl)glucosamine N-acyltransferase [Vicinamibacterales bacterium]